MEIEMYPLEKIVIDEKEIFLGCSEQDVRNILGEAESVYDQRHYYFNSELAFDYDSENRLEFIEFLGGHYGKLKPRIYGVSAFDVLQDDLIEILSKNSNGKIDDSKTDSYAFLGSSIGVWTEEDDNYWMTIGMGVKGYYDFILNN